MKGFYLFCAFLCGLIFLQSCKKDEAVPLHRTVYLGSFTLLPSSIHQIPYHHNDKVVFIDALGEEMKFDISSLPPISYDSVTFSHYGVIDPLDTVTYVYSGQFLVTSLINESETIRFRTELETQPYVSETDVGRVGDLFSIGVVKIPEVVLGYSVYYEYIDFRTYPSFPHVSTTDSMVILGRTFFNVKENFLPPLNINSYPDFDIKFNNEFGIVSFIDESETLWRFDRFE